MNGSILFLGTGSILGTPSLPHLFKNIECLNKNIDKPFCQICKQSLNLKSRNTRNPFSIIIMSPDSEEFLDEKNKVNFLFEIPSSFRISMFNYAVPLNIKEINAIFCLGSNEASFCGVDEVREIQSYDRPRNEDGVKFYFPTKKIPIFMTSSAIHNFNDWYNYIIKYSLKEDLLSRTKIGCIELNILNPRNNCKPTEINNIEEFNLFLKTNKDHEHFKIENGIEFYPITINYTSHISITSFFFINEENLVSSGYHITYNFLRKSSICIIPKYSIIPEKTLQYLKNMLFVDVLIIPITPNDFIKISEHSIVQTINFCKSIKCNRVYFYNIDCSNDHDYIQNIVNENTKGCDLKITVAFDSLIVPIIEIP